MNNNSALNHTSSGYSQSRINQVLDKRLKLVDIIGIGAYGVVYTAINIKTGIWYAVKALSKIYENIIRTKKNP